MGLRDAYHTLRLVLDSQVYCGITPFYGSLTYFYLRLGMGLNVSPTIWLQLIYKVLEYIQNRVRCEIVMEDVMVFSRREQCFENLANLFKGLIKFG